jgi:hypothetical protein
MQEDPVIDDEEPSQEPPVQELADVKASARSNPERTETLKEGNPLDADMQAEPLVQTNLPGPLKKVPADAPPTYEPGALRDLALQAPRYTTNAGSGEFVVERDGFENIPEPFPANYVAAWEENVEKRPTQQAEPGKPLAEAGPSVQHNSDATHSPVSLEDERQAQQAIHTPVSAGSIYGAFLIILRN